MNKPTFRERLKSGWIVMKSRWIIILMGLVWSAALLALAISGVIAHNRLSATPAGGKNECPDAQTSATRAKLVPKSTGAAQAVGFGRNLGDINRHFEFELDDPKHVVASDSCIAVEVTPFVRDTGDAELAPDEIETQPEVEQDR